MDFYQIPVAQAPANCELAFTFRERDGAYVESLLTAVDEREARKESIFNRGLEVSTSLGKSGFENLEKCQHCDKVDISELYQTSGTYDAFITLKVSLLIVC